MTLANMASKKTVARLIFGIKKKNLFQLNCERTRELIISFIHSYLPQFPESFVDGNPIAQTTSAKLLGVTINSSLTWNHHLYFLVQLKGAQINPTDLVAYLCMY